MQLATRYSVFVAWRRKNRAGLSVAGMVVSPEASRGYIAAFCPSRVPLPPTVNVDACAGNAVHMGTAMARTASALRIFAGKLARDSK